jgi:hypothetical protein
VCSPVCPSAWAILPTSGFCTTIVGQVYSLTVPITIVGALDCGSYLGIHLPCGLVEFVTIPYFLCGPSSGQSFDNWSVSGYEQLHGDVTVNKLGGLKCQHPHCNRTLKWPNRHWSIARMLLCRDLESGIEKVERRLRWLERLLTLRLIYHRS